jgi:hypothetical protein
VVTDETNEMYLIALLKMVLGATGQCRLQPTPKGD